MNLNRYPKFTLKDYHILPAFVMFEAIASCWMRTGIQFPADWQHLGKHVFSFFAQYETPVGLGFIVGQLLSSKQIAKLIGVYV